MFDEKFFLELEKKLIETNSEHVGVKCARAQFNLLQNVRAQLEEVDALRHEIIILKTSNEIMRKKLYEDKHEEGDPPPL